MRVVGIDPSLTSTGVAVVMHGTETTAYTTRIAPRGLVGLDRIRVLRNAVRTLALGADLAVIEGPSYGSQGNQRGHHERAGLWWAVLDGLSRADVPTVVVAPAARAKYAAGKGNAAKDAVLAAVVRRYVAVDVDGNDEADALVLAAMGARWLGHPLETFLPQTHLAAMDAVAWPEREAVTA